VIDGKLDTVISKIDYVVSNQNANTQLILKELAQIENQIASAETITWIAIQAGQQHDISQAFTTCKLEFETHASPDVSKEFSPANIEYNRCLGIFLNEATHDASSSAAFSTDIDFNRGDLLQLITKRSIPEHALALLPYFAASAIADPKVTTVTPDPATQLPPFDPETWAEGVQLYLQMRYWVPEVHDDTPSLNDLVQNGADFEASYNSVITRQLPRKSVARYVALVNSVNQYLEQTVQPLFDQAQASQGLDLIGSTRPSMFSTINVFAPAETFKSRIFGTSLQLGLAQETDAVRGDGHWALTAPKHGGAHPVFWGCLIMDVTAQLPDTSSLGPRSFRFCTDPSMSILICPQPGSGCYLHGTAATFPAFSLLFNAYCESSCTDPQNTAPLMEQRAEERWPQLIKLFRSSSDWPVWENQLPVSDGFSQASAATFFDHSKDKLIVRLASLRSQLSEFIVQKETDPNATDQEKAAVAQLKDLTREIDRAYVTAVSLLVLSYGECVPATGFDDWPTEGMYGMISGTALHDRLGKGILPVAPALDASTFPVLFQGETAATCPGFPRGVTEGLDWLSGYKALEH
jgi:hypothetical protein